MTDFKPLDEIPMDRSHMLDQATGQFRSVRDGLPELIKNSKDQYARLGILDKVQRQIVVVISDNGKRLAVLDFAGAKTEDFDGWVTWSSRTAGRQSMGSDIEAGHGNGGKAFMVRGARSDSYMCSSTGGRFTKMGFKNADDALKYRPGWFTLPDGTPIKEIPDPDPNARLDAELSKIGLNRGQLPTEALAAYNRSHSFTLVYLDSVREWTDDCPSIPEGAVGRLVENLQAHPQASLTLESCSVWVLKGRKYLSSHPIGHTPPEPYPGFERAVVHQIPETLMDPMTQQTIPIPRSPEAECILTLRTSQKNLRLSDSTKPLNVIRVRDQRNIVASWSVADLGSVPTAAFVYGALRYSDISPENLAGTERTHLADTSIVRALQDWVSEKIDELGLKILEAQASRETPEQKSATNDALKDLRDLMKDYLDAEVDSGTSSGGSGTGGGVDGPTRQFGYRIDQIEFEGLQPSISLAVGTSVPTKVSCFEQTGDGKRLPVRMPNLTFVVSESGVVELTPDKQLKGLRSGNVKAKFVFNGGHPASNEVEINVVGVNSMTIEPPPEPLLQGERRKINMKPAFSNGTRNPEIFFEAAVDEAEMGKIGRSGHFTAGSRPGTATVRVRYGPDQSHVATCAVTIGNEKMKRTEGHAGADIPQILACGTPAPGFEEYAPGQNTQPGGTDYPTIIEDPIWQGRIIWINTESSEARKVRMGRGSSGVSGTNTKTFRQFLALKCFEVLLRLKAAKEFADRTITTIDLFGYLALQEIDCAPFLDEAYNIIEDMGH